ncbi:MAG: hypothetical protein QXM68_01010 [Candidatus Aenigmatarchaeota archaeon]|nr:hypothetical protein [Candidatus Aenigmarchaeota archaeon]
MGAFEAMEKNIPMIIKNPRIVVASALNLIPGLMVMILFLLAWKDFNQKYSFKDIITNAFKSNDFNEFYKSLSGIDLLSFLSPYIFGFIGIMIVMFLIDIFLNIFYTEAGRQYMSGKINMDKCVSFSIKMLPRAFLAYFLAFIVLVGFSIFSLLLMTLPIINFIAIILFIAFIVFYIFTIFMIPPFVIETKANGFDLIKKSFEFSLKNFGWILLSFLIFWFAQITLTSSLELIPIIGYFILLITELFLTTWIKSMPIFLYYDILKKQAI